MWWPKTLLEIRIIQLVVSGASYLHTFGVYFGRFECILCIAYSHSHTYCGDIGHLLQSCSSSPFSTSSSYCFLSCYLAIVALDVVCIPASHLSASGRACSRSGRRRRGRLGWRNVSVLSGIKAEKCRMAVFPRSRYLPCHF